MLFMTLFHAAVMETTMLDKFQSYFWFSIVFHFYLITKIKVADVTQDIIVMILNMK